MVQVHGIALAAGGQLARMAVGFAGIVVVVAAIVPARKPEARARPETGEPERPVDTVAVTVPDGVLAKSLTITDASGRELATLTLWYTGETAVVARRSAGPGVSCWLDRKDRAILELIGMARRTRIEMEPDGTIKTFVMPRACPNHREPSTEGSSPEEGLKALILPPFFLWPICILANWGRNPDGGVYD